jgi:hypothetical protein
MMNILSFASVLLFLFSAHANDPSDVHRQLQNFPNCRICGAGKRVTNPSGLVYFPNQPVMTCKNVASAGMNGYIDPKFCGLFTSYLTSCKCRTVSPIKKPTRRPTRRQTRTPTRRPTRRRTRTPTRRPTRRRSRTPTRRPTRRRSRTPTRRPTRRTN